MPIEIDLSTLPDASVQTEYSAYQLQLAEKFPHLQVRRGIAHDLLIVPESNLAALWRENFERLERSSSLLEITADPTLADDAIVDRVLSTKGVLRRQGAAATGEVTIVISKNQTTAIAAGVLFSTGDLTFTTETGFVARPAGNTLFQSTDRTLVRLSDGNYGFTVTVVSTTVGDETNIRKDVALELSSPPSGFVRAYSAADFGSGRTTETNTEMLARLAEGMAARTLASRAGIPALVKAQEEFEGIVSDSVIGLGDAEMVRDRRGLFPISVGSRADWYVRTTDALQRRTVTKTATLASITSGTVSVWNLSIDSTDFPAFYAVESVLPSGSTLEGGFDIGSEQRFLDMDGLTKPDVADAHEGTYSAYQTAVIQFTDTVTATTDLTVGDTASYDVVLSGLPLIADIQDFLLTETVDHYGADILVKAPVPCFVRLAFTIYQPATQAAADVTSIKQAIVDLVHSVGFTGRLAASAIASEVHAFLTRPAAIGAIQMAGSIRYPDNETIKTLVNTATLEVPNEPLAFVTPNTVAFYVEPDDIHVSLASL